MGYTESGKAVKNVKRLMATFSDEHPSTGSYKTHRKTVECTRCGKTFKTNNGNLPKHKMSDWRWSGWGRKNDDGTVSAPKYCDGDIVINESLDSVMIEDIQYNSGDKVLYVLQELCI